MRTSVLLFFCWLIFFIEPAFSQNQVTGNSSQISDGRTFAVILGISDYQYIRPLSYADNDAELFRDFLKSPGGGKVSDDNIFCLLNEEAKAANFWVKGMSWLKSKELQKGDKLFIFLAGHGDAINQEEYFFLTYDCNPAGDKNNYIVTGSVQLYNLKSRIAEFSRNGVEVILIMDACRTNELPGGEEGQQTLNAAISEKKSGEILMLATGAGQESLEDQSIGTGHGLFTYYLIDGLAGMADNPANPDKTITLEEIKKYVGEKVPVLAQERFKRVQEPFFCCDEKIQQPLAIVDSVYFLQWELAKSLSNNGGGSSVRSVASRSNIEFKWTDTILPVYFKYFTQALDNSNLTGMNNSAEYYLDQMLALQPDHQITQQARASLVAEYINTAQHRINLYLQGKDFNAIHRIRTQFDENETSDEVNNSLERMEKVARKEFSEIAMQIEKAISLLNEDEQIFASSLKAKLNFFKAMGFFEKKKSAESLSEALDLAYNSYNTDTTAAYILNTIASLYLQYHKPDSAVYFAKKAIHFAEKWRYPYTNVAYSYRKLNNRDSAMVYYKKAIAVEPKNADGYVDLGKYYYSLGMKEMAIQYYQDALKLDPENVFAHNNLCLLFNETQVNDSARFYFAESIRLDPENASPYINMGLLYRKMREYDSAKHYFRTYLEKHPTNSTALNNLVIIYKISRQYDSVRVIYHSLLARDTNNIPLINNFGLFFYEVQNLDSSIYYFKKSVALDSSYAIGWNNLGTAYNENYNYPEAIKHFQKAISIDSGYVNAYFNLGVAYLNNEQYDQSVIELKKAISYIPEAPEPYYYLACAYSLDKKDSLGLDALETALKKGYKYQNNLTMDPDLERLRTFRAFHDLIKQYFPAKKD